jgi:phenylacetate-CoA ligase
VIWNTEQECISRGRMEEIQLERLKWTTNRVYSKVPHYREKFDKLGIIPENIKSLEDLKHLPFTTKEDLRSNYPFGLFAVPRKEVVRVHASSGTTGRPVVVGYTGNDLNTWTDLTARMVTMAGVTSEDVAQVAFNMAFSREDLAYITGWKGQVPSLSPPLAGIPNAKSC